MFSGLETPSGEEWPGDGEYNRYSRTVAKFPRLSDVAEIARVSSRSSRPQSYPQWSQSRL